ncbi:MAG: diaminopimelate epimerase [Campylobacterota bacterium]|nr:diaminopimelate epimerase [Campylobacterota bacterium]
MKIEKYNASGNTFVIFHTNKKDDYSSLAVKLCKQEKCDGMIVVVPHMVYDFQWLFYNNDGSDAAMCGNGTRAVAHYAYNHKLAGSFMKFLTGAGEISCKVEDDIVETTMIESKVLKDEFMEEGYKWILIDAGVPHLVIIVDDLNSFDLELCSKMRQEYNANVNYVKIDNGNLYVRTFERGVEGETLACGTGMTACFIRANQLGLIGESVDVYPKSGEKLTLRKEHGSVYFKGKVTKEYTKEV